jgi:predicted aspartyl protease
MADVVQLACWPSPDRLAIGIQLRNLSGQSHHETEELIQLDTGYSGDILIPFDLFVSLNLHLWSLSHQVSSQGSTITGQIIQFTEAEAEIIIPKTGQSFPVIVQTFANNTRFLIGRNFLRHLKVLLDGPGDQTCLLTSTPAFENETV